MSTLTSLAQFAPSMSGFSVQIHRHEICNKHVLKSCSTHELSDPCLYSSTVEKHLQK